MQPEQAEKAILQTIWQEAVVLGPRRGLDLLQRSGLEERDFGGEARPTFTHLVECLRANQAPVAIDEAMRAFLDSDELRSASQLDFLADRLKSRSVRLLLRRAAQQIEQLAREPELDDVEAIAQARKLVEAIQSRGGTWSGLSTQSVEAHLADVADGKKTPTLPTGFKKIDEDTGGLPSTLIVIVAMPGVGKSAWVGSIIRNIAMAGHKIAMFSMEDHADWLVFRALAHESGVPQGRLRWRPLADSEWGSVGATMPGLNAWLSRVLVDNREALTPAMVLSAARQAIVTHGVKAVFLDNATAMRFPRGERRDLEFQEFLVAARALANETGVPFVVVSHAKRREGLDVDELPALTDCAESSAYEKLCRLAYGLCRNKEDNTLTVGVLKNTNGRAWGRCKLQLRPESALVEAEQQKPWDWSSEVRGGNGSL